MNYELANLLTEYGYAGMFVSAFLAGSVFPLSSEVVMLALLAAGLDPWALVAYATVGNTLGSMLNYAIGTLGRMDWIEKYLHVKKKELDRARHFMSGRGACSPPVPGLPKERCPSDPVSEKPVRFPCWIPLSSSR